MERLLGLYIHIPFCRSKCDYCDFYSLADCEDRMDAYQKALLAHLKAVSAQLKQYQVDTVYFGGGTPSFYGEKRLRELLGAIHRWYDLQKNAEITLECNPDSVDQRSLTHLRRAGINRISLGMQSANDEQLAALHRPHTFAQVQEAVRAVRGARIKNLSLDLIYGLPGQTMESWKDTVEKAIALQPEHLSCYGLKVEEGTPLAGRVSRGERLPDDDEQADMYLWTARRLEEAGLHQYEISNFARLGRESRHNLKYWLGREYIGFGPGAHSHLGGRRFSYRRDLEGYIAGVGRLSILLDEDRAITQEERACEYLMLRMRTVRGIAEWEYRREYLMNFDPIQRKLDLFETRGWAVQTGHRWHFTPEGFLISNQLIGQLLEDQESSVCEEAWDQIRKAKHLGHDEI